MRPDKAATLIQCLIRRMLAKLYSRRRFCRVWFKKFDPIQNICYYLNVENGQHQYEKPQVYNLFFDRNITW